MGAGDYYKILKVKHDATDEELKNHERKEEFEAKLKQLSEAYDVLSDPNKRQMYDFYGDNYLLDSNTKDAVVDQCSFLCSLEELYNGCKKKYKVSRTVLKSVEEILKIDIKPGWENGTKITFPGKGNKEQGAPADLVFVLGERPHAIFKRDRNDLVVIQKILLADALTGTSLNLTTSDGRDLTIQVTDIVKSGYELVVPNEGMPISKKPGKKENLRIKFDVICPSRLTTQQKCDLRRIQSDADY
ncbi:hypothetical protein JHK87_013569 [Glycine soja]|nr:hypothetical protein JHK87_013569 [Glycine soja]